MNIKPIEEFTLEECRAYLQENPAGEFSERVMAQVARLEQQQRAAREQAQREAEATAQAERDRRDALETRVQWMDINHFRDVKPKYKNFKILCYILATLTAYSIGLLITLIAADGEHIYSCVGEDEETAWHVLEQSYPVLSCFHSMYIDEDYEYDYEYGNYSYSYSVGLNELSFSILIISSFVLLLSFVVFSIFSSPLLAQIRDIENPEGRRYLRMRNEEQKLGLCRLGRKRLARLLPFAYDRIFPCGAEAYVCVANGKRGLYHAGMRKMVLAVEYDQIEWIGEEQVVAKRGNHQEKFTTKGFRVVES